MMSSPSSPLISIKDGGDTAISSFELPDPPLFITFVHIFVGGSLLKSWQPTIPSLSNEKDDVEYHVTQQSRSSTPSASVSIGKGGASANPFCARKEKIS